MFTGPYGVRENGAWQDSLLVKPEDLVLVPDSIDDVVAASLSLAYLTAQITLTMAGFKPGMTMLAPAIGGSVGNATYRLAQCLTGDGAADAVDDDIDAPTLVGAGRAKGRSPAHASLV
jgi:NADPH:quinone reductase-like Zn-dependent oxidoreductase